MFAKIPDQRLSDQDLHAFVDGELDGRRCRRVVRQLATDPTAADRLNGFLRQHGEFATLRQHLDTVEADDGDARIAELTRQLAGTVRHHRRVRLSSVVSSVLLAGLVGSWSLWGPDPSTVAGRLHWPPIVLNAGPQVLFGRDPFDGAQLASGEIGEGVVLDEHLAAYAVRRPDFAAHGLSFIGGNALKSGKTPAIRLVYGDEANRRVYLFVGTVGSDADVALTLVPEGHVSLHWRRGPLVFALIGPKDSEQLLELMRATSELLAPVPTERPALPATAAESSPALAPVEEVAPTLAMPQSAAEIAPAAPVATETLGVDSGDAATPLPMTPTGGAPDDRPKSL
jgi:anti-sigma factor RsiW